ncbi:MAG: DUF2723 domain-containing protein, partial [bacterium]
FILSLCLFLSTICRNLSAIYDGAYYLNCIDSGKNLFLQTHFLYNFTGYLWVSLLQSLGFRADSEIVVPVLNSIIGSLLLCLFYILLRTRAGLNRPSALIGTGLLAFSYAFWLNSVSTNAYMIALFFMVLVIYVLSGERLKTNHVYLAGVFSAMGVLYHLPNVLFVPVALVGLFMRRSLTDGFFRSASRYFSTFIPIILVVQGIAIIATIHPHSLGEILNWITSPGRSNVYWQPIALKTLLKSMYGFSISVIGSHWLFAIPSIKEIALKVLGDASFVKARLFIIRNFDPGLAICFLGLSATFAVTVIFVFISRLRGFGRIWNNSQGMIPMACVWFAIYGIFFFFWDPSHVNFKLPQTLTWWLVFSALAGSGGKPAKMHDRSVIVATGLMVLLLLVINFFGSISLLMTRNNDYYYHRIAPLGEVISKNDLLILERKENTLSYAIRYTKGQVLDLPRTFEKYKDTDLYVRAVADKIGEILRNGGSVFIMKEAVDLEPQLAAQYGEGINSISKLWALYRSLWVRKQYGDTVVYVLQKDNLPDGVYSRPVELLELND